MSEANISTSAKPQKGFLFIDFTAFTIIFNLNVIVYQIHALVCHHSYIIPVGQNH